MKWAISKKTENERAGFDPMDCNFAVGNRQDNWWSAEWPTPEESAQPTVDLDFAGAGKGDGKGKGKGKGMQFGGKRVMNPTRMMMVAINVMKRGGKGFNNNNNYNNKGGFKGGGEGGKESGGKGC